MVKGQLTREADERQSEVENLLFRLGSAMIRLEHDSLRVRQAIRRSGLYDLLAPVLLDHDVFRALLRELQESYRETWDAGQARRWTPPYMEGGLEGEKSVHVVNALEKTKERSCGE